MINTGISVPEPAVVKNDGNLVKEGAAFMLSEGSPLPPEEGAKPEYVSIRYCDYDSTDIPCIRLTSNMVFEADVYGDFVKINVGDKFKFKLDGDLPTQLARCENGEEYMAIATAYAPIEKSTSNPKVLIIFNV